MRRISEHLRNLAEGGGPFVGDDRLHLRVTVEPGWWLSTASPSAVPTSAVVRRAVGLWRADTYSGTGPVPDASAGWPTYDATPTSTTGTGPIHLAYDGANAVWLPGSAGNLLATFGNANRVLSIQTAIPYLDLGVAGAATITYDPAGEPVPPPDGGFDAEPASDPETYDQTPETATYEVLGDGAIVDVPAGVVAGGHGVAAPPVATQRAPLLPGETYTASVEVRVPLGVGYDVILESFTDEGTATQIASTGARAGTGDWERIALSAAAPVDASTGWISPRVTDGTAAIFNARRFQFEVGDTATEWTLPVASTITAAGRHLSGCAVLSPERVLVAGQTWYLYRSRSGYKTAIVDRALWLLAAGDSFEVPDDPAFDFNAFASFTTVAVFRAHGTMSGTATLVAKSAGAGTPGYELAVVDDQLRWRLDDGVANVEAVGPDVINGETIVAAGRRSPTTAAVLVNGVAITSVADPTNDVTNAAPLRIGGGVEGELIAAAVFAEDLDAVELSRVRDALIGAIAVPPADTAKAPFRWWQRADNSQVEVEIPNVLSLSYDHSLDADADSCQITIVNQIHDPPGEDLVAGVFGDPGYFTPDRANAAAASRWGTIPNEWAEVLDVNACIRVYWGYGGHGKSVDQAVADGDILLKGVWLVDDVTPGPADNTLSLTCRDMFKLLVDQDIYPGLVPASQYPLERCRWHYETHKTPLDLTYNWPEPDHRGADGWWKRIVDFAPAGSSANPQGMGAGYWIAGNDGAVFAFGSVDHLGDLRAGGLYSPVNGIESTPTANGYWLMTGKGHVHAFGDATWYGESAYPKTSVPVPQGGINYRAIRTTPSGKGYWLMERHGRVEAFGDATWYGDVATFLDNGGTGTGFDYFYDMMITPSGKGYWLGNKRGRVYAFGDAIAPGEPLYTDPVEGWQFSNVHAIDISATFHHDFRYGEFVRGYADHPTRWGYWGVTTKGVIYALGAADIKPAQEAIEQSAKETVHALAASRTGLGYQILTGIGEIYAFGDAGFYGSLRRQRTFTRKVDNTGPKGYTDLTEIVRDLLLWSGFYLAGTPGDVYGNLEATGTYNEECFRSPFFDKRPVIDVITELRQIVGYYAWCDEEGAARFESPNYWVYGNFFPDGGRTTNIPVIDEAANLFDWTPTRSGAALRSQIIIASAEPTASMEGTVVTRTTPPNADQLKGIVKPAAWTQGELVDRGEQALMAELVAMQLFFKAHTGSLSCVPHPGIETNDQVWVYERSTGEARVHYVRGINVSYDAARESMTMSLTTHRLGTPDDWLVDTWRENALMADWINVRARPNYVGVKLL